MTFYSAFSSTQFWNRQYQIARNSSVAPPPQASNWKPLRHDIDRRNREYQASLKKEEIIRLKLESQALLVESRELELQKDKQSRRQLSALVKQKLALKELIAQEMALLAGIELELRRQAFEQQQIIALVVLQMACPYLNITGGGSSMH